MLSAGQSFASTSSTRVFTWRKAVGNVQADTLGAVSRPSTSAVVHAARVQGAAMQRLHAATDDHISSRANSCCCTARKASGTRTGRVPVTQTRRVGNVALGSRSRRRGSKLGAPQSLGAGLDTGAGGGIPDLAAATMPTLIQPALGLSYWQTVGLSVVFAMGLMVLVGSLRPALVVLHNSWYAIFHDASANPKLFQDSFFGFLYKLSRTFLLMVALAWTYTIVLPMSSSGAHKLFPPERFVKLLGILFNGYCVNMVRKKYLARFAGMLRTRLYGRHEPTDLIPAHVYDRETGILVWGLTILAALDSLGLPLEWVVKGLGASTVVLGILASVVLRDTVANYFGGLIIIAASWFVPKEVVRVLLSGRREISGRVEHIGLLYTKLINRAGKVIYMPNSAMVAYKVENLTRAPYREFREQLAISFKDLEQVPLIQKRVEEFLCTTSGCDMVRGVSLAPRCTLTGINSFAGGAVIEVVCYNDYRTLKKEGFTTMRLRHHIFIGIAKIFDELGVRFAVAGTTSTGVPHDNLKDNGLQSQWADNTQSSKKVDAMYDALDDRAPSGMYVNTPWL